MNSHFNTKWTQVAAACFAGAFGCLLFLSISAQRPEPFSSSVDGLGYFLPLIGRTHEGWLSGSPLRVLWDLGQGWIPWESGQIGYLYPGYTFVKCITNFLDEPTKLLEYSALLHLGLLGLFAWIAPPITLSPAKRLIYAAAIVPAPGILMIGMNWHNYLTPMPWFLLLSGIFVQCVAENEVLRPRKALALLFASAMFFSASHPQIYVIGLVFLSGTAFFLVPRRATVQRIISLGLLQIPFVVPLIFLYILSIHASPTWVAARAGANILSTSLPPEVGLRSMISGTGPTAIFNPILPILIAFSLYRRKWLVLAGCVFMAMLVVPSFMPGSLSNIVSSLLSGFRWPAKLAVFSYPLMLIAIIVMRPPRIVWYLIVGAAVVAFAHDLTTHENATSLQSIHHLGVSRIVEDGKSCANELGLQEGDRIAFVGHYRYNKTSNGIPPAMQVLANNAPLLIGLESQHLYEPLEPAGAAAAHDGLTVFWRGSLDPSMLNDATVERLAHSGVDVLLSPRREPLNDLGGLVVRCSAGVFARRIGDASAFPGASHPKYGAIPLIRLPDGSLMLAAATPSPPTTSVWRVQQRPDKWRRTEDGHWIWDAPLPGLHWITGTIIGWIIAIAFACTRPTSHSQ